jgi:endonuclease/exonuclease/phosphatase family metal-dependent hydrolase
MSAELTALTFNIHSRKDGWRQRAPLVVHELRRLSADVVGLQEASTWSRQAAWLAVRLRQRRPRYRSWHTVAFSPMGFLEGDAMLIGLPLTSQAVRRFHTDFRVAQRATVRLSNGREVDVYNTHLADGPRKAALRQKQAELLLDWVATRPNPAVLLGDFNTQPDSDVYHQLTSPFRSAHAVIHGTEPPSTSTSGVLDYVLVSAEWSVLECHTAFDPRDGIAPSDHRGVFARLSLPD